MFYTGKSGIILGGINGLFKHELLVSKLKKVGIRIILAG